MVEYVDTHNFVKDMCYCVRDILTNKIKGYYSAYDIIDDCIYVKGYIQGYYPIVRDKQGYQCIICSDWNIKVPRSYDIAMLSDKINLAFSYVDNEITNVNLTVKRG